MTQANMPRSKSTTKVGFNRTKQFHPPLEKNLDPHPIYSISFCNSLLDPLCNKLRTKTRCQHPVKTKVSFFYSHTPSVSPDKQSF